MDRNKNNDLFVLMAALAAIAIYNIACGIKTGEVRGKLHWVALSDDPTRFWNIVVGNSIVLVASIAFLCVLCVLKSRRPG
ncbi:hypothetical protein [Mesorhizobium sp. B4-1-1]|uniref:hypothetical protein n=1 Tax=Mesorhizobium sp. B4-1-1 TaxID=2589890 RepID=UPI001127499F|nr:hypothetical protein [Mesorhizobium sp. B4-1-1]TPI19805.1 hypothetical protein FJW10_13750 [Mesorhizobium sp. B4-1-1]